MPYSFSLKNFEGPAELLLLLIQKDEMEILEIAMHLLTRQLLVHIEAKQELNEQSDLLALMTHLLLLKTRKMTPLPAQEESSTLIEDETKITLIEQLLENFPFKEIVTALQEREQQSHIHFARALPCPVVEKNIEEENYGLEEVTLHQLRKLFETVYTEAQASPLSKITAHKWEVKEKIEILHTLLAQQKELFFDMLFKKTSPREELIVTFLALLELIKQGKLVVILENNELKFIKN